MKRFHAHIAVDNLANSIAFYSRLFGQQPSKQEIDYAKWMLEDPRINFAISSRGHATGLNHFGMQVDSDAELNTLKLAIQASGCEQIQDQPATTCCYAHSNKHWLIDPQGIAWEHFYTLSESLQFGHESTTTTGACCLPGAQCVPPAERPANCCAPEKTGACCA